MQKAAKEKKPILRKWGSRALRTPRITFQGGAVPERADATVRKILVRVEKKVERSKGKKGKWEIKKKR